MYLFNFISSALFDWVNMFCCSPFLFLSQILFSRQCRSCLGARTPFKYHQQEQKSRTLLLCTPARSIVLSFTRNIEPLIEFHFHRDIVLNIVLPGWDFQFRFPAIGWMTMWHARSLMKGGRGWAQPFFPTLFIHWKVWRMKTTRGWRRSLIVSTSNKIISAKSCPTESWSQEGRYLRNIKVRRFEEAAR